MSDVKVGDIIEVVATSETYYLGNIGKVVFVSSELEYVILESPMYIGEDLSPMIVSFRGLKILENGTKDDYKGRTGRYSSINYGGQDTGREE